MKRKPEEREGDPDRGDAILKRMLQSKPKPHKDMVKGKAGAAKATPAKRLGKKPGATS